MNNENKNDNSSEIFGEAFSEDNSAASAFAETEAAPQQENVFASAGTTEQNLFSEEEKKELKKPKKKKKKFIIPVILVILALLIGLPAAGVFAAPTVFLKLGDSKLADKDYDGAQSFYNLCFGSEQSKPRIAATDAIKILGAGKAEDAIDKLLDNGITVNVKYDLPDGAEFLSSAGEREVTFKTKEEFGAFYKAKKENYSFVKWETLNFSYVPEFKADEFTLSLKAVFEPTVYTIAYSDIFSENEGLNPSSYTVETETIMIKNPVRTGYTFKGWNGTDIEKDSFSVSIPQGSDGNRTFTATWEANDYHVTMEPDVECQIEKFKTFEYHGAYTLPGEDAVAKKGYKLVGWRRSDAEDKSEQPFVSRELLEKLAAVKGTDKDKYNEILGKLAISEKEFEDWYGALVKLKEKEKENKEEPKSVDWYKEVASQLENDTDTTKYQAFGKHNVGIWNSHAWNIAEDVTINPDWRIVVYTIDADLNAGSDKVTMPKEDPEDQKEPKAYTLPPAAYTVSDANINITDPERHGYTFEGWSYEWDGVGKNEKQKGVVIPTGSVGNISLKAVWVGNKRTVTLNPDGGNCSAKEVVVTFGSEYKLPVPTKTGYDFTGWSENGQAYSGGVWNVDRDVALKANWKAHVYDVTYDAVGGKISKKSDSFTYDKEYKLPVPTRSGYTFEGWFDANGKHYTGGIWKTPGNVKLTARWRGNSHKVYLDPNGGSVSTREYNVVVGNTYILPTPTKAGYSLNGWYEGGTYFAPSGTWNVDKDVRLVANWTVNTYKATLNTAGGSMSQSATYQRQYGSSYSLPTPTRKGYTFAGWYNGSAKVSNTGTWWWTSDVTFVANWTPNKYTVTLNASGGSGVPYSTSVTYGGSYSIPTPSRPGYTFNGWYNGNSYFTSSGTWNTESNITLTARWTANTYTGTLNANGGSVSPKSISCKYGDRYSLPTPTKTGNTFEGWKYGNSYYSSGTWNWTNNVTFTAQWDPITYTVYFDANGGYVSTSYKNVTYGEDYSLPTPTRSGYDFKGWWYSNTKYPTSGTWDTARDRMTLEARWDIAKYDIKLDANGGKANKTKVTVQYGGSFSLPDATRTGYEFLGWYEGSYKYPTSGTYTDTQDTSLEAKWEANEYTVYLDPNGGDVSRTQITVVYGEKYDLPEPTLEGSKFKGWYSGSKQYSDGKWNHDNDLELVAKWEIETYSIKLSANGGTGIKTTIGNLTYGSSYSLPTPTKKGHEFLGWFYKGSKFPMSGDYDFTSNITLEAEWEPYTTSVTLDYGEIGGSERRTFTYGKKYELPKLKQDGYTFKGWYGEDGKKMSNSGTWTKDVSQYTITAEWVEK